MYIYTDILLQFLFLETFCGTRAKLSLLHFTLSIGETFCGTHAKTPFFPSTGTALFSLFPSCSLRTEEISCGTHAKYVSTFSLCKKWLKTTGLHSYLTVSRWKKTRTRALKPM